MNKQIQTNPHPILMVTWVIRRDKCCLLTAPPILYVYLSNMMRYWYIAQNRHETVYTSAHKCCVKYLEGYGRLL